MKMRRHAVIIAALMSGSPVLIAQDEGLAFDEDYYFGFSQGMYYGLMLAGTEYDVAWCVKSEVADAGSAIGSGGEFQRRLERILQECLSGQ